MDSRTFGAFTRADGKMAFDSRSSFDAYIASLPPGSRLTITVAPEQDAYTDAQRKRFWLICQMVADLWNAGRGPENKLTKDHAKYVLCRSYVGVIETPMGLAPKGITGMSKAEMSEVQEKITADFAAEGTPLPLDGF